MEPYNRQLTKVLIDGKNVNLEMIKAGFAEVYRGKSPKNFNIEPYKRAEALAKEKKIGI